MEDFVVSRRIRKPGPAESFHWRDAEWKVRLGRPYVAIEVRCKAHPTHRLALLGCKVDDVPITADRVLYVVGDVEENHGDKVHVRCRERGCALDWQRRKEHLATRLSELRDAGRVGTTVLKI